MLYSYFKIACRNLTRQKLFSLISILGMAIALAVCMLIMIYVSHEFSYDLFHKNSKKIVFISERLNINGTSIQFENTSYATGQIIQRNISSVLACMRIRKPEKMVLIENPALPDSRFSESRLLFSDQGFFSFFSFPLLSGNTSTVLASPFSVVISRNMAKKYFGDGNPLGKTLKIQSDSSNDSYQVTGIAENSPSNSSIQFDFLASNSSLTKQPALIPVFKSQKIENGAFKTYLLLDKTADTAALCRYLSQYAKRDSSMGKESFSLTPMKDMHLGFGETSAHTYIYIFLVAASLILLLALVNYMSLATARSISRAKEVGIRKVAGADRKAIAAQFYVEAALFALIAFILAYALCFFLKPALFTGLGVSMDSSFLYSRPALLIEGALLLFTIALSGSYPAIILSAFKPVSIITGKMSKTRGSMTRKIFTVFQFSIATGLIICGIIIDSQLYFFRHTDTGINRENILMIPVDKEVGNQYQSLKKEIGSLAGVSQVATSIYPMYGGYDMSLAHKKGSAATYLLPTLTVDRNFISVLGLQWKEPPANLAGLTQFHRVILNETAVQELNLRGNPLGQFVDMGEKYEVAGVVRNFNFSSLTYKVQPIALFLASDSSTWSGKNVCLYIKVNPRTNLPAIIKLVKEKYIKYDGARPFEYSFLDESFNRQYKAEDRMATIFNSFTLISFMLAALGLFGLVAFTSEQRTKEIAVRKVLGASAVAIYALLSNELLVLIFIALFIACPVAGWAMHTWLHNFAYRVEIQWWMFAVAGSLVVSVALITISYHALKAAVLNPVDTLRTN